MDHLPTPLNATPPIEIPFVANIEWDGMDFETFPSRHGFAVDADGNLLLDDIDAHRLASVLQSWLYFGLLTDLLGSDGFKKNFFRQGKVGAILDTSGLQHTLCSFFGFYYVFDWPRIKRRKTLLEKKMRYVERTFHHVSQRPISRKYPLSHVLLSVESLCLTLKSIARRTFRFDRWPDHWKLSPASAELISTRMIESGWCRALVAHASKEYDINTFLFFSRTKPPLVPWINHENCSSSRCIANHVQKATYENRHVTGGCSCGLVHVDGQEKDKMMAIIKRGRIPLIKIHKALPDTVRLEVVEHHPRLSYTAISHVWSDGLGNPHSNALPLCQLQKLHNLLQQHPSRGTYFSKGYRSTEHFWTDTLCIPPVEPGDPDFSLRLDCIDRMALIYATAWNVLVLDQGLQQIRISASSYEEIIVQLICCAWNQRCWTLQEATLSRHLSFQLADGIIAPFEEDFQLILRTNSVPASCFRKQHLLDATIDLFYYHARRFHKQHLFDAAIELFYYHARSLRSIIDLGRSSLRFITRAQFLTWLECSIKPVRRTTPLHFEAQIYTYSLNEAWDALQKRSTTMSGDLYIVLANLLGFHPYQLSSMQGEQRVKALIMSTDRVPMALLYATGRKLANETPSQRWIPAQIDGFLGRYPSWMKRTPQGFLWEGRNSIIEMTPSICRQVGSF
ncbi:hypothetical protein DM02DRAFT_683758 [Periconia macrospinosa]|uniref:Heterokaryon incompatibility domain-containing protein n=1 Tax=Periconia macrospinosa TaxID=97972 RepID=A0A2V1DJ47_9PLEO|nr:hypothetical protein DM02DRAFT_683758 [Periconia macrospinosa]